MPDPTASLAADLGIRGFERWTAPANERTFAELTRRALDELRAAAVALE
ncbi:MULTISPECIES: hypothetical protein [Streptomyces]|uniref:Uncharacterized protein n=2 Tax=Streptomyces TaxID=1883 RepID=A0ABV9IWN7_9ACTN